MPKTTPSKDIVYDTPIEDLSRMMRSLSAEDRVRAKERLRVNGDVLRQTIAEEWQEKQRPSNMDRPMAVTIETFRHDGSPVCGSFCFMDDRIPGYRNLQPGEVVIIDVSDPEMRKCLATRNLALTDEMVTRPLVFPEQKYADLTHPRTREKGTTDEAYIREADRVVDALCLKLNAEYHERLSELGKEDRAAEDLPPSITLELQQQRLDREVEEEGNSGLPQGFFEKD